MNSNDLQLPVMRGEHFGRPTMIPPPTEIQIQFEEKRSISITEVASVVSVFLLIVVIVLWLRSRRMGSRYLSEKKINEFYNEDNTGIGSNGPAWLGMGFNKEQLGIAIEEPRPSGSK